MSRFAGDPRTLISKGGEMIALSTDFENKINDVYQIVQEMLAKDYISPEAKIIGNNIQKCRETLSSVPKMIKAYGEFYQKSGIDIKSNQENNSSNYNHMRY